MSGYRIKRGADGRRAQRKALLESFLSGVGYLAGLAIAFALLVVLTGHAVREFDYLRDLLS